MPNAKESPKIKTDHLIIGAGVAGLSLALKLAKSGSVHLITKSSLIDNNSWHAQGGIASVMGHEDTFEEHIKDTLTAGAGLCHEDIVKLIVEKGPKAILELVALGALFTKESTDDKSQNFHLTKEGGHSKRRVLHAEDLTGREIIRALLDGCYQDPQITITEDQFAIDLITSDKFHPEFSENSCLGAYVLDRTSGSIYAVLSSNTYVCTGGHGKAYLYTSNPDSATGDGLAMAWRAGCRVANLEFMQFHPTCLYHPQAKNFLLSEALRGEGALIINSKGHEFIKDYHKDGSMAPRDIVARAIDSELKKTGDEFVLLDATKLGADKLNSHFPNLVKVCLKFGYDLANEPVPIVPAAHYSCGGIVVDQKGQTNIKHLYALGEVSCTGLHGANRLASNSLLEALVYADLVAADGIKELANSKLKTAYDSVPHWYTPEHVAPDELYVLSHLWEEIRRLMWNYVGIVRTTKRLERALSRITTIRTELHHYYWDYQVSGSVLEVRNIADVAYLTIRSAMARRESRGIHFNQDFPLMSSSPAKDTILCGYI